MKSLLCFSIDLSRDKETNQIKDAKAEKLAKRFNVKGLPALLFLEPDGQWRDGSTFGQTNPGPSASRTPGSP